MPVLPQHERFIRRVIIPIVLIIVVGIWAGKHVRKTSKGGTAFVRWRPQIQALVHGENVYEQGLIPDEDGEADGDMAYPNPPLMAICLYPLTLLPPVAGAVIFFLIKVAMAIGLFMWAIRLASGRGPPMPVWGVAVLLVLALRPYTGDLDHGNVNIVIAFLVVLSLWMFAQGRDVWAGVWLALATAFKVTPALLIPYFVWKRQWKLVASAIVGLAMFLTIVPGLVLGQSRNLELLGDWYAAVVAPYAERGEVETRQHNQSMPALLYRWLSDSPGLEESGGHEPEHVNFASLDPGTLRWITRVLSVAFLIALAWLCRTPTSDRRDWRLACEYGLMIIGMLVLSERTWKHHYTPFVIPLAALVAYWSTRAPTSRVRTVLLIVMIVVYLLISSTSREIGGRLVPSGQGHKWTQAAGAYLWAAMLVFVTLGAILRRHRTEQPAHEDSRASTPQTASKPGNVNDPITIK
jgi:hypothetical protein